MECLLSTFSAFYHPFARLWCTTRVKPIPETKSERAFRVCRRRQPPNSTSSRAARTWRRCRVAAAMQGGGCVALLRPRTHIISIFSSSSSSSGAFFSHQLCLVHQAVFSSTQRLWKWEKVSSDSCLRGISPFAYNASGWANEHTCLLSSFNAESLSRPWLCKQSLLQQRWPLSILRTLFWQMETWQVVSTPKLN